MHTPGKIAIFAHEYLEAEWIVEEYVGKIVAHYGSECEITVTRTREEFGKAIEDATIALCWNMPPECFARAKKLRWISFGSAGLNHTMFPELLASDVTLTTMSGVHPTAIAEHVMAMILAFSRKLVTAMDQQRARVWDRDTINGSAFELAGKTLAVIGTGRIGSEIARLGKAFGMVTAGLVRGSGVGCRGWGVGCRVWGVGCGSRNPSPILGEARWGCSGSESDTPHPTPDTRSPNVFDITYTTDEKLRFLERADVVVLALPLTSETEDFIGTTELSVMQPTSYIVNIARAGCIDEPALIAALQDGRIAGAALDVFLEEPLPPDHPYWAMHNVIITPHTAGVTPQYPERAFAIFSENLTRFREGRELVNVYDGREGTERSITFKMFKLFKPFKMMGEMGVMRVMGMLGMLGTGLGWCRPKRNRTGEGGGRLEH